MTTGFPPSPYGRAKSYPQSFFFFPSRSNFSRSSSSSRVVKERQGKGPAQRTGEQRRDEKISESSFRTKPPHPSFRAIHPISPLLPFPPTTTISQQRTDTRNRAISPNFSSLHTLLFFPQTYSSHQEKCFNKSFREEGGLEFGSFVKEERTEKKKKPRESH